MMHSPGQPEASQCFIRAVAGEGSLLNRSSIRWTLLLVVRRLEELFRNLSLSRLRSACDGCLVILDRLRALPVQITCLAGGYERPPLQLGSRALRPRGLFVSLCRLGKMALAAQCLSQAKIGELEVRRGEVSGLGRIAHQSLIGGHRSHSLACILA